MSQQNSMHAFGESKMMNPTDWQASFLSSSNDIAGVSVLQNQIDGFAVDVYNQNVTGGIYIDDITITELE